MAETMEIEETGIAQTDKKPDPTVKSLSKYKRGRNVDYKVSSLIMS